jgi:UDP-2-acetamido-3-amino-2,3-dideoxy-glucuronate N-acetyltransferase
MTIRIHPTADVSKEAQIGAGTLIWHFAQIRPGAHIGENCIIGKGVYIDTEVSIGNNVKIQNNVSLYHGVSIEDGVFLGPHVCFTNDLIPRAINPDGSLKSASDWIIVKTLVRYGAAIGANSTIRCGVTIGRWAMVGAGTVVTRDIPGYGLVWGVPGRLHGFACPCGHQLDRPQTAPLLSVEPLVLCCPYCGRQIVISDLEHKDSTEVTS